MDLPYRWNGAEGRVRAEVRANDDPASLGCGELARGFPCCRATIDHPAVGYADMLGWVQLLDSSHGAEGFEIDPFEPVGAAPHPFAFYGEAPTLFDAPHSDDEAWDFLAHSFLCGLGGEVLEFRHEARAVLGFSWGFLKQGPLIDWFGPDLLAAEDWDGHLAYLRACFPGWTFAPGFREDPLQP
jgi:hypothetical protein